MSANPTPPGPWLALRRYTAARIALPRSGGSVATAEILRFNHDHALARDAVHAPFDADRLAGEIGDLGLETLVLHSAAATRSDYLRRPDLGRRLDAASAARLATRAGSPIDLALIVGDGLSALAARHAVPVLATLLPLSRAAGWTVGPVCLVRGARVALLDEVGAILRARLALILLGERPGLGQADSLGAYLEYDPRPGRTDAERNCVSNIRPDGLSPAAAADRIFHLLSAARRLHLSGTGLKDDTGPAPELRSGSGRAPNRPSIQ